MTADVDPEEQYMHLSRRRAGRLVLGATVAAATALVVVPSAASAAGTPGTHTGDFQTYVVLFKGSTSPGNAGALVQNAGGSLVADYSQIGVAIARSDYTTFSQNMTANSAVDGASATTNFGSRLPDASPDATTASPGDLPNAPASDTDSLSGLQWDMRQMQAPEAHAITGGSPSVLVGDIDTGLDYRHPDLRQNVSDADSANCVSGAPVQGAAAADDDNGHGTHTAGTIAAAANHIGIVGVAPNVRIAGIKAGNAAGYFFPEAVICAFYWAGSHHMDVTNSSYFADPFEYNCRNDAAQRAIWKAEQRAIRYAMNQGVTVVAAEGNDSDDLSHPTTDVTSPDFPEDAAEEREITNACVVIPVEIPGVIGVTSTGSLEQGTTAGQFADHLKAYYSSFGQSSADVTAPGGDYYWRGTDAGAQADQGLVLSTWPATLAAECGSRFFVQEAGVPGGTYCLEQGTSMASPHVAGLAALVISRFGDLQSPQNGKMRPGQVEQYVEQTADPQACPSTLPNSTVAPSLNYLDVTGTNSDAVQQCQGGPGHNSWYGNGEVNALAAVTHDTSNR